MSQEVTENNGKLLGQDLLFFDVHLFDSKENKIMFFSDKILKEPKEQKWCLLCESQC